MSICPKTHCLTDVIISLSPNRNARPIGEQGKISLLVIHGISLPPDQFGNQAVSDFFLNNLDYNAHPFYQTIKDLKVSSHLFINRQGIVTQFVPFNERAWHAGASSIIIDGHLKTNCNDFSIGIELEGSDTVEYTLEQYHSLSLYTKIIMKNYPAIKLNNIVGHSDIAPGRKTDPGPWFDWKLYKSALI